MNKLPLIERGHTGSMDFQRKQSYGSSFFLAFYIVGVFLFFVIVVVRLFHLTVVKGAYYATLSDNNRVREIIIEPKRGKIFDRKGVLMAANHEPVESEKKDRLVSARIYYHPDSTSHIIGYRQTADKKDLERDSCINKLKLGDKTGKKGIEKTYECELRGTHGKKLVEVDAMGHYMKTLSVLDPQHGENFTIALDSTLQQIAQELLVGQKGAIVGLKPDTGEVLVLASNPTFDPQVFEDGDAQAAAAYFVDTEKPMFNRATEGTYPPGSTFKMFVAAAGLEEKVITSETTIEDTGVLKAGTRDFHNWYYREYGRTEGEVNLLKSLQRSNDIYYYELGAKLGPEKIKKWAELFGFHNKTNIGIDESAGIIPSTFWKKDTLKEPWYLGDSYNFSIGQGYVATTPLQIAVGTAAFANGGKYCTPMLLKEGSRGTADAQCKDIPMAKSTYEIIREGMKLACETGGTGYPFFDFQVKEVTPSGTVTSPPTPPDATSSPELTTHNSQLTTRIPVGCKTGTAESFIGRKPHAWFTIFAPFDDPEIVLTVLVEEAGEGSQVAAPIAKEIISAYFERVE